MRGLLVQVQPERSPGVNLDEISAIFEEIAADGVLVRRRDFLSGNDDGPYFNFTLWTGNAKGLWPRVRQRVFEHPKHGSHMALAAMAIVSIDETWDDYLQLRHWDTNVPCEEANF